MTLQTRLVAALGLFVLIAVGVSFYALMAVRALSALAADIYGRPLLTLDHARSAAGWRRSRAPAREPARPGHHPGRVRA